MSKTILAVTGSFLVGTVSGFILGYCYMKKKNDEDKAWFEEQLNKQNVDYTAYSNKVDELKYNAKSEEAIIVPVKSEEKKEDLGELYYDPSKIVSPGPAKIAMPDKPGVDYTAYTKKKMEAQAPTDGDDTEPEDEVDIEESDFMETYDERIARETKMINEELQSYQKKKGNNIDVLGKNQFDPEWPDIRYDSEELLYFICDDVLTDSLGNFVDEQKLLGNKLRNYGWFHNGQEDIWVRNNPYNMDYHVVKIDEDYNTYFPYKNETEEEEE